MPVFIVTFTHPDEAGWQAHLMAHVQWLQDQLVAGTVLASGPTETGPVKSAMLIMTAESVEALKDIIATDPFDSEGLIAEMTITPWDPIFGAFSAKSSRPGQFPLPGG